MKTFKALLPVAALWILFSACGPAESVDPDFDPDEVIDTEGKEDGISKPAGSYTNGNHDDWTTWDEEGEVALVILKKDKTYRVGIIPECIEGPCDLKLYYGKYKFTTSHGKRYIRFLKGKDDSLWRRYEYKLEKASMPADTMVLKLRLSSQTEWQHSSLKDYPYGLCVKAEDCELQTIDHLDVPGAWSCEVGTYCTFRPTPATDNTCLPAGGRCDLDEGYTSCQEGESMAFEEVYSCGADLGLICCLPEKACPPICVADGPDNWKWENSCNEKLLCYAAESCEGAAAPTCGEVGTAVEGWYLDDDAYRCRNWDTNGGGRLMIAKANCE